MSAEQSWIASGRDLRRAGLLTFLLAALSSAAAAAPSETAVLEAYGRLPLRFERNDGQVSGPARYFVRAPGYTMFVTPTAMVMSAGPGALRVELVGARRHTKVRGEEELAGRTHYLVGNDRKTWRTGVVSYAKVRCRGVYPGIDVSYHGRGNELEYDFVLAPGADPARIRLRYEGGRSLRVDDRGDLVIALDGGEMTKRAPLVYQEAGRARQTVPGRWVLRGNREAGFEVGAYDHDRTLVIDPVLSYSTYLGGNGGDEGYGVAVDGSGNAYVTGQTTSTDFPTLNPYQAARGSWDVFVTKLSSSGSSIVYSTYLGGSGDDHGYGIAVDSSGSATVAGDTWSTDFPTVNPVQTDQPSDDAFVAKLSPSGDSLVYSTYLGGSYSDWAVGIAVDGGGSAYVVGSTNSYDFPVDGPFLFYSGTGDAFVTKLSPTGYWVYSTFLGGSYAEYGRGIAADGAGSAIVVGSTQSPDFPLRNPVQVAYGGQGDAFVTKLTPAGDSIEYSTFLGGTSEDQANGVAVDSLGDACVTGRTLSTDFPTWHPYQAHQAGSGDAFVTRLSPTGSPFYSTYLGGAAYDEGFGIAADGQGNAYVTGRTYSTDFPTMSPLQTDQGDEDAFVTKLSPSGATLLYSTYLGGAGQDEGWGIAADAAGNAYVTGTTLSADFPTQAPFQPDQDGVDAFVTRLAGPPTSFYTLPPCRLIDTRNAVGPRGGPALVAGADRAFVLAGQCLVPATASAVSVNVTVTQPTAPGHLRIYPAGALVTGTSTINYAAGVTRANNAILLQSLAGITVRCAQASGSAHLVLDVNGYFE